MTPTSHAPTKAPRKGIQSLETGFRILDFLVKAGQPVALKAIAQGTGLSPSNINFYLVSLMKIGAAIQDSRSGHYGLGPYAVRLGLAGLEQFDLFAVSRDRLLELANTVGHSVFLGVWGNHGPTIVYRADGIHSRSIFELRVGSVLPVLRSALGRLFLAHLPEPVTSEFVDAELKDFRKQSGELSNGELASTDVIRNRADIKKVQEHTRQAGMSRCRSGILSDYTAVSAPIFDYGGSICAGVTVMGRIGVLDDDLHGETATAVSELAQLLSRAGQGRQRPV
jgi:DNA-binding IclR family transcriptional regulator